MKNEMKSETISIKVSKKLKERLIQSAKTYNMSISGYVTKAIEDKINNADSNGYLAQQIGILINNMKGFTEFEETIEKKKYREAIYFIEDEIIKD